MNGQKNYYSSKSFIKYLAHLDISFASKFSKEQSKESPIRVGDWQ